MDDGIASRGAHRMWKQLSKLMSAPSPCTDGDVTTCGGLMRFDFDECTFSRHTLQKSCPGQWAIALVSDYQRDGSFVLSGADLLLQYTFRTAKGDKTKHEHTNIDWSRFAQDT